MSGIAGIIRFDGAPVEAEQIKTMTAAMAYRGPDGINHWVRGSVALGQCMLCTTPESLEETQPLTNDDESLVLVMDGRVDNWEELRRELLSRGAKLRTRSDAELVLRAYEVWGRDCLQHIDGDFAFVIWDARRQEAFCARDRIGNKPFHYHWDNKRFVFASELRAIFAVPWVPQVPNDGMLAEFLSNRWFSSDETLWNGVLRLVAAHRMSVSSSGLCHQRYWEPNLEKTNIYKSDLEYFEHYRELFADSVRRLSRSHMPVAYEVSGGLDSSAVFCVAEHLRRSGRLPAPSICGYTAAFQDENAANELLYARAVGSHLGIPIDEVPPSRMPLSWFRERAKASHDYPGFPNAAALLGLRQRAASRGSRVILTGDGGDEWLAGSRCYYAEELVQRRWSALYECLKTDILHFGLREPIGWFLRYGVFLVLPPSVQDGLRKIVHRVRGHGEINSYWLSPKMKKLIEERNRGLLASNNRNEGWCTYGQRALTETLEDPFIARIVENVERLATQAQVEFRAPMRTYRFVQYAFSTPERLRLHGRTAKNIHVQALRGLVPDVVLNRTDKAEFSVIFREHLDNMKELLAESIPQDWPDWVVEEGMRQLFSEYQTNPQRGWPMWPLWSAYGCSCAMPRIL